MFFVQAFHQIYHLSLTLTKALLLSNPLNPAAQFHFIIILQADPQYDGPVVWNLFLFKLQICKVEPEMHRKKVITPVMCHHFIYYPHLNHCTLFNA